MGYVLSLCIPSISITNIDVTKKESVSREPHIRKLTIIMIIESVLDVVMMWENIFFE